MISKFYQLLMEKNTQLCAMYLQNRSISKDQPAERKKSWINSTVNTGSLVRFSFVSNILLSGLQYCNLQRCIVGHKIAGFKASQCTS